LAGTGRPEAELALTAEEREQLVRWSRRPKSAQASDRTLLEILIKLSS
jgi:hypothetical protein